MTSLGPFDLHGAQFLMLYGELALIAVTASLVIPSFLRPAGRPASPADADELALLAGGRQRFAEATLVRLLAAGAAIVQASGKLQIRSAGSAATAAERRILALSSPATWNDVMAALAVPAARGERRLEHMGLRVDAVIAWQLRLIQTAPLALLFAFGSAKWVIGALRDRPVGFLTGLLILTMFAALWRYAVLDRRTRAGHAALAAARRAAARLRRATPTDEAPLAVALFGTAVLAGSLFSDFHKMRSVNSSSGDGSGVNNSPAGGDSSSGGADGSGGCGGGGCGGCGS